MAQRANIDYDQIKAAARQGDGSLIQMAGPGGFTDGNVPVYAADGSLIDSGVAPGSGITYPGDATKYLDGTGAFTVPGGGGGGSGAPWLSITDPSSISFSWRNQGSASVQSRTQSVYLLAPAASGDNIKGREISAPSAPWSITAGLIPHVHNQSFNSCGLYVSDGTKIVLATIGSSQSLGVNKYNTATSFNGTYDADNIAFAITPIFPKVVYDGTNLKWYWSPNGLDFHLLGSHAASDFLASISFVGFFANSNNSGFPAGVLLVSWVQGTS